LFGSITQLGGFFFRVRIGCFFCSGHTRGSAMVEWICDDDGDDDWCICNQEVPARSFLARTTSRTQYVLSTLLLHTGSAAALISGWLTR
jgi:hypothetical protein